MAARGLVNGRDPLRRSGRDLVFPTSPYGTIPSTKQQKLTFWVSFCYMTDSRLELRTSLYESLACLVAFVLLEVLDEAAGEVDSLLLPL